MSLRWMDLSGSPVLLLPRALSAAWRGFYLPADPDDGLPDLELPDGTSWRIDTTFDFDRPRTDYDRLCATLGAGTDPCLVTIGEGQGVGFGRGHDRFAWYDEHRVIVGGGATPEIHDGLVWEPRFRWRSPGPDLLLMNSCDHGADPDSTERQRVTVRPATGSYEVATAEIVGPVVLTLCRFRPS